MKFYSASFVIAMMAVSSANAYFEGFGPNDGQYKDSATPRDKISAAVQTKHSIETKMVDIPFDDIEPQIIEVEGGNLPLEIHFKSSSSRIKVHQTHESGGAGQVEQTQSEEEPHRLIHEVKKPIIQEVREIITPYRKVIQEIQPVVEEIHTIVAKGERRRNFDRNQSKSRGGGGGSGSVISSGSSGIGAAVSGISASGSVSAGTGLGLGGGINKIPASPGHVAHGSASGAGLQSPMQRMSQTKTPY